ncbi:hypothetical protein DM01DRAFT_1334717 [Hesseltinella vesiculosa]|uniref:RING-type domain-containing protein n=1 Tax=Hesseltinella vesiculosa TaxID=101127 RepID=A0A1X2GM33_9FUNG|nr:hypothetical protein DM01DRAFT_1334717 [Hesseltinella vesiculosa]
MGAGASKSLLLGTSLPTSNVLEYGSFNPQGIYPVAAYDDKVVRQYIKEGLLAPFYHGVNDDSCQLDAATIAAQKKKRQLPFVTDHIECPICLLNYPEYINYTRCCCKPICTECFIQIRRSDETLMTPVRCSFCNQPNLGVVHYAPAWSRNYSKSVKRSQCFSSTPKSHGFVIRRMMGPNDPNVVLVDQIYPDWQDHITRLHLSAFYSHVGSGYTTVSMSGAGSTRRVIVRPERVHRTQAAQTITN